MTIDMASLEKWSDIFRLMDLYIHEFNTVYTTTEYVEPKTDEDGYALDDENNAYDFYKVISMKSVEEFDIHEGKVFLAYTDFNDVKDAIMHFGSFTLRTKRGIL